MGSDTYAYTFDYPVEWMLDPVTFGARAPGGYQLTSWPHEPGMVAEVPAGGTIMNILIQLWDPKADLSAFVEQQKTAWDASGFVIMDESTRELEDGRVVVDLLMETPDKQQVLFSLTTVGERYLEIVAEGDIVLGKEILSTLASISQ